MHEYLTLIPNGVSKKKNNKIKFKKKTKTKKNVSLFRLPDNNIIEEIYKQPGSTVMQVGLDTVLLALGWIVNFISLEYNRTLQTTLLSR